MDALQACNGDTSNAKNGICGNLPGPHSLTEGGDGPAPVLAALAGPYSKSDFPGGTQSSLDAYLKTWKTWGRSPRFPWESMSRVTTINFTNIITRFVNGLYLVGHTPDWVGPIPDRVVRLHLGVCPRCLGTEGATGGPTSESDRQAVPLILWIIC
jgi:hypothetical protein